MGSTFDIVNHDRKERLSIGLGGFGSKRNAIGHGIVANRAAGLLLSGEGKILDGGDWRSHRIEVVGMKTTALGSLHVSMFCLRWKWNLGRDS